MDIYFGLLIIALYPKTYNCYVAYEMFPGFGSKKQINSKYSSERDQDTIYIDGLNNRNSSITDFASLNDSIEMSKNGSHVVNFTQLFNGSETIPINTTNILKPVKSSIFNCSEDEVPFNIGPYEVPTQRDLVLHIRKTLIRSFNSYQRKALFFLKDIQGATRSTSDIDHKCGSPASYKKCVKRVSVRSQLSIKSLVTSLERQRNDVSAFIEGTICKVKEMKADPVQLLKTLAMEEAVLEFSLPGFLRLLGACTIYCNRDKKKTTSAGKPLRHMSDQDLVVKHFLTKKNYLQLLKS